MSRDLQTCPFCGSKLGKGNVDIRGTLYSHFFFSFNWLKLFLAPRGYRRHKEAVPAQWVQRKAQSCDECKALILPNRMWGP